MKIHLLILVYLAFSRCNPHLTEHLNPSILPQHLLPIFGDAILNEFGKSEFTMLVMIQMRKLIILRFLGGRGRFQITRPKMQQFLTRRCDEKFTFPLSNLHFSLDYEAKMREAVLQTTRRLLFLIKGNQLVEGNTCNHMGELQCIVVLHIFHPNGRFDAILTGLGDIFMGRIGDPLELKVKVINSPFNSKRKAVVCTFDPKSEMLIVGFMNGDFQFYKFTDRSQGATPLFEMELSNSYQQTGGERRIVSITASPCGKYFVILHDFSCGVLVTKNSDTLVVRKFMSEHDFMHFGIISALAFFGSSMILTVQSKKYFIWKIEIDGTIAKISEIEPIKIDGLDPVSVKQIIVKDYASDASDASDASFIFKTWKSIHVLRLEDNFKILRILISHPIYEPSMYSLDTEFNDNSIFFKRNMLILVVPSQKIIKLFWVKETEMTILAKKDIKRPTRLAYDPHTSVLTLDYDFGWSTRCYEPSVRIGI